MNTNFSRIARATLAAWGAAGALGTAPIASAQVAGGTTSVSESTQLAAGWSVKKTLMGKTIYNDAGAKVGRVDDLIISLDKSVSYVIVGAGGFVGIGRHDVAIPISQIQDQGGRLVMPGASQAAIKAMPEFAYTNDSAKRDLFLAAAEKDIASGKSRVAELEKKAGTAATDAKARINTQITALQADVKAAETKLGEMKQAAAARWKEFEAGVNTATSRLRKSTETAAG